MTIIWHMPPVWTPAHIGIILREPEDHHYLISLTRRHRSARWSDQPPGHGAEIAHLSCASKQEAQLLAAALAQHDQPLSLLVYIKQQRLRKQQPDITHIPSSMMGIPPC